MRYLKVAWHHELPDEPVLLYSELDDDGYETRKVEIYRDGRHDHADADHSTGSTELSYEPIPPVDEIAEQAEFSPTIIDAAEFDQIWHRANAG